MLDTT